MSESEDNIYWPTPVSRIQPKFEDENGTTVSGKIGDSVDLDCNIFMLQDYTVSWAHRSGARLDILTIGNMSYTLEPRFSPRFGHPGNWGLRIVDLRPSDAGVYLCQISTFPTKVNVVNLKVTGPMIEIVGGDMEMVYNAGSHLEVKCIFRNTTDGFQPKKKKDSGNSFSVFLRPRDQEIEIAEGSVIRWLHNGEKFSHRNRRRVRTVLRSSSGDVVSVLSIKSAIIADGGNYTCRHGHADSEDTVRIIVVDGEHSAAIYKNSDASISAASSSSSSSAVKPQTNFFSLALLFVVTFQSSL